MTFDLDSWREIRDALGRNKLRTALTAAGVFWGIFLLMIMLGSGNGLRNGVYHGFGTGATNTFFLWTQATSKPHGGLPPGRRFQLNNGDVAALRAQVSSASIIAPRLQLGGWQDANNVTRGTKNGAFRVTGDVPEMLPQESIRITRGRFLNRLDLTEERKVAVVGSRVVEVLFEPDEDPIDDAIEIQGVYFKVVGTFASTRSGDDGGEDAQGIFVPFTTFQRAFHRGDSVDWLAVTSVPSVPASVAEDEVLGILARRHRVAPDDDRAFGHFNLEEEFGQVQGLFAGIRTLVWIVGIGTLVAGVIGVSNIMLVIVRERTREIGIRRAIGATPASITGQILLEAILLTSIAGYAGLIAGIGVIDGLSFALERFDVEATMFQHPGVELASALEALVVLIVAGGVAGLMPARRAVGVRPVVALRAE